MTAGQTIELMFNACRVGGVDAELLFEHFDRADIAAYREALERGWIDSADLPKWMESTALTIAERRCLCGACKGVKA